MSTADARAASFHEDADEQEDDRDDEPEDVNPCPGCGEPTNLGCEPDCLVAAELLRAMDEQHREEEQEP